VHTAQQQPLLLVKHRTHFHQHSPVLPGIAHASIRTSLHFPSLISQLPEFKLPGESNCPERERFEDG
jgi:hypothetical protein